MRWTGLAPARPEDLVVLIITTHGMLDVRGGF
jgi:hypothetical protein